ncbi:DUF547 domain-containing protein [Pontibacter sp. G13]|uniref:DUF547 domain-containing protein n=1 Tax=Pontibacter sp. G13 TaxID=3074898 RepID=UPI0028894E75|nr:DUF547 domain-containing protein [Pontibacter sp. G13]WNJ21425.1 DUF547 domain-containing protein [Pontibacter sp. G13]
MPWGVLPHSPVDHGPWSAQLGKYIQSDGSVDYQAWQENRDTLDLYVESLLANPPAPETPEDVQLAHWINAYNALTIQLILNNYPLKSIKDLDKIPYVSTVWHNKLYEINGLPISLNNIEHQILRQQFDEPRIHFAINCASVSCPVLRPEAYFPESLDQQLEEQAHAFFASSQRNIITQDEIQISKIFLWFQEDFTRHGELWEFINTYSEVELGSDTKISYLNYDWNLNDSKP